jgi:hypothetical protein
VGGVRCAGVEEGCKTVASLVQLLQFCITKEAQPKNSVLVSYSAYLILILGYETSVEDSLRQKVEEFSFRSRSHLVGGGVITRSESNDFGRELDGWGRRSGCGGGDSPEGDDHDNDGGGDTGGRWQRR